MMRRLCLLALLLASPAAAQDPVQLSSAAQPKAEAPQAGAAGGADPSQNALNANAAAAVKNESDRASDAALLAETIKRLDQLREAEVRRLDELREVQTNFSMALRDANDRRSDDLRDAQEKISETQFSFLVEQAKLDREAFLEANRAGEETAKGLALSQQQTAEVLSGQVVTAQETATANQERLEERTVASQNATNARLGEIERSLSELAGRSGVADPQTAARIVDLGAQVAGLATLVRDVGTTQTASTGRDEGRTLAYAAVAGAVSLFFIVIGGLISVVVFISRRRDPEPAPAVRRR